MFYWLCTILNNLVKIKIKKIKELCQDQGQYKCSEFGNFIQSSLMLMFILSSNVFFGLEIWVSLNIIAELFPKSLSSDSIVSVLLGKGFCVVSWAIACLWMSLLPMYKKTAVTESTDIIIDIVAILFNDLSYNVPLKDLNLLAM